MPTMEMVSTNGLPTQSVLPVANRGEFEGSFLVVLNPVSDARTMAYGFLLSSSGPGD